MKYLNTAEVAAILRKSREWVAQQCHAGNLRATKLGNDWRISEDDLTVFMSGGSVASVRDRRESARQRRRSA